MKLKHYKHQQLKGLWLITCELISGYRFNVLASWKNSVFITWQFSLHCDLIKLTGELHAVRDSLATSQQVVEQQAKREHVRLLVVDHVTSGDLWCPETCQT